ncbi:Rne/Rng family ribonuclease [Psychromicrobium lacuslunae]|uniref:Ribonuclease E n=1 Tax=Psychromicrobium lacuslunae TaxID=1618207 RepID=A0A0D4BYG7_9MICC|nr:Rne/Rng family ribonuclease [Psychromicrobium lacuslunae]AJT41136.1 ribonuclease E [Psychromicrobium lacuslunae]
MEIEENEVTPAVETAPEQPVVKRTRRKSAKKIEESTSTSGAEAAETQETPSAEVAAEEAPVKKTRRTTRSKKAAEATAEGSSTEPELIAEDSTASQTEAAPVKKRSTTKRATTRKKDVKVDDQASAEAAPEEQPSVETSSTVQGTANDSVTVQPTSTVAAGLFLEPASAPTSLLFHAPDLSLALPSREPAERGNNDEADQEQGSPEGAEEGGRRRRSRNRRNKGGNVDTEASESSTEDEAADSETTELGTSRRRRRRRRGDADLELTGGGEDDPPNTITRVRAPRQPSEAGSNRVTSVRGSTRLEAKKQRRRESRDTGRRRQVITEAEFLARRESVDRVMVVRQRDERIQIGVLEDGILAEHFVSKTQQDSLIGNVYLGKVQNVLPSMEAAFVDIGRGRNAVLYAGEVDWEAANLDGQPRRIEHALKSGDSVLVQVTKDPVGHKGARLTSQISLPGRYLVYVPGGSMTGISRKLPDVERNRLKRILKDNLPENAGVIVRTAAEGASEEELTHDINRLRAQWENIESRASSSKTLAPEMLYGEPDLTIKVVRDVFNEDFSKLIISGEQAWDTVEAYVTYVAPDLLDRLEKWDSSEDIFASYRIDEQISKALERKVFLPSGGSLVIDRTEAMTVVDVNTGKFTGSGGNLEETVTKNNLEAAEEVVRQLRLRDIGGIIVIDFIDMVLESNRDLVLRRLVECLGRDRTKHQVAEVTSLGLVQMTRKRMGTGLLEVFGEQCEVCAGRGVVTHAEPVEHRSVHSAAAEQHQPRNEQQRPSRGEKKRSRNRQQNQPEPEVEELSEQERAAKASAARTALANIAAAAQAAHHDLDQHVGDANAVPMAESTAADQEPAERSTSATSVQSVGEASEVVEVTETADANSPVLTFGAEQVVIPHRKSAENAEPQSSLSLESLTDVFDHLTPAAESNTARKPRSRRHRAAGRAQGAANSTEVQSIEGESTGAVVNSSPPRRTAQQDSAQQNAAQQKTEQNTDSAEPLILGVGVPAADL